MATEEVCVVPVEVQEEQVVECKGVDFKESLLDGFCQIFNDESTSDVTIVVGTNRFYAHKAILAATSEYFHRMFYGGDWKESKQEEVTLHDTPACQEVFEPFLRCLYTGTIDLNPDTAYHVLTLADKYASKVRVKCLNVLTNIIDDGTVEEIVTWMPSLFLLEDTEQLEKCHKIICYNFKEASKAARWSSLSMEHLLIILKRAEIFVPGEIYIYAAVQSWVLSQKECSHETIKELLSYVEFKSMDASELAKVDSSPLAKDRASDILNQILNETCRHLVIGKINQTAPKPRVSSHLYTRTQQKISFGNQQSSQITPKCSKDIFGSSNSTLQQIVENFEWKLQQSSLQRDPMSFTLTKTKKPDTQYHGSVDIRVKLILLLKNSHGVVRQIEKMTTSTTLCHVYRSRKEDVAEFTCKYGVKQTDLTKKFKCFYCFDIESVK